MWFLFQGVPSNLKIRNLHGNHEKNESLGVVTIKKITNHVTSQWKFLTIMNVYVSSFENGNNHGKLC